MAGLIFGKKWAGIAVGKGFFYCPYCRTQRPYLLKKHKHFYSFFKLPLIPLKSNGDHIECRKCKQTFWQSVLECSPEITKKGLHPSILKLMIKIMVADGKILKSEMITIKDVYKGLTGEDITENDIKIIIKSSKDEDISIDEYLKRIKPYLSNYNKILILKSSFLVSVSDGEIREEEKILMYEICHALTMPVEDCNELLLELQNEESEIFQIPEDEA